MKEGCGSCCVCVCQPTNQATVAVGWLVGWLVISNNKSSSRTMQATPDKNKPPGTATASKTANGVAGAVPPEGPRCVVQAARAEEREVKATWGASHVRNEGVCECAFVSLLKQGVWGSGKTVPLVQCKAGGCGTSQERKSLLLWATGGRC